MQSMEKTLPKGRVRERIIRPATEAFYFKGHQEYSDGRLLQQH
jgi:hypothetical protein